METSTEEIVRSEPESRPGLAWICNQALLFCGSKRSLRDVIAAWR